MITVEGRNIAIGERVEVYYNIQKGGFSVVSRDKSNPDNGRVVAYASDVQIKNATFHVNDKKYDQILEKNKKTVYAVVRGILSGFESIDADQFNKGYCNPFSGVKGFIDWNTKQALTNASQVVFYDKFFGYAK